MEPEDEIWVDIKDFEGLYQVSSFGRVRSLPRKAYCGRDNYRNVTGKILSLTTKHRLSGRCTKSKNKVTALTVSIARDGDINTCIVHRLVAEAFLGIARDDRSVLVSHKDKDVNNNHHSNLVIYHNWGELMTASLRSEDVPNSKCVRYTKGRRTMIFRSYTLAGDYLGLTLAQVRNRVISKEQTDSESYERITDNEYQQYADGELKCDLII